MNGLTLILCFVAFYSIVMKAFKEIEKLDRKSREIKKYNKKQSFNRKYNILLKKVS